jgi:transcriptional regulator with XRE-family HTH domain
VLGVALVEYATIPDQVRAAMARAGVSAGDLAAKLGHRGHAAVSRLLSGEHEPRAATLQRIADVLGAELVRHEVYAPAARDGDKNCHLEAEAVPRIVTGGKPAESLRETGGARTRAPRPGYGR